MALKRWLSDPSGPVKAHVGTALEAHGERALASEYLYPVGQLSFTEFLSSESERLTWKQQGLLVDSLWLENAASILHSRG